MRQAFSTSNVIATEAITVPTAANSQTTTYEGSQRTKDCPIHGKCYSSSAQFKTRHYTASTANVTNATISDKILSIILHTHSEPHCLPPLNSLTRPKKSASKVYKNADEASVGITLLIVSSEGTDLLRIYHSNNCHCSRWRPIKPAPD